MSEVTQIAVVTADEKRKAVVIDLLERILVEAREGNGFETLFIVATYPDRSGVRTSWTVGESTVGIVGRLAKLQHDLLYEFAQHEEELPPPPPPGA